jgi:hypothetical protein
VQSFLLLFLGVFADGITSGAVFPTANLGVDDFFIFFDS